MIRAFVVFEGEPEEARYAEHLEFVRKVPGATFRHGRVFGVPMGEQRFRYYAEFEWPDMDTFKAATSSAEFMATGKDAMEMGIPFHVHFAEVNG